MRWETAIDVLLIHGRVKDPPRGLGHSESRRSRRCKETEGEERAVCLQGLRWAHKEWLPRAARVDSLTRHSYEKKQSALM